MNVQPMVYMTTEEYRKSDWYKKENIKVIHSDAYQGFTYHIVNMYGLHMCAYVEIADELKPMVDIFKEKLDVHGGLSYAAVHPLINKYCIGWDYAHLGDWTPLLECNEIYSHTWTSTEVSVECREAIDQIIKIYGNNKVLEELCKILEEDKNEK